MYDSAVLAQESTALCVREDQTWIKGLNAFVQNGEKRERLFVQHLRNVHVVVQEDLEGTWFILINAIHDFWIEYL